jgi:GntR family transcriptional regulator
MTRASPRKKAREVRYRQVAEDLLSQIKSGRIAVGDTLPSELELLERYEVSRHTMREAMRMLCDLGVIERRAGAGTVVKSAQPRQSYLQVVHTPSELLQYPPDAGLIVRSVDTVSANQTLARLLQCPIGRQWCRVRALRRFASSGLAICWLDLYLLPEYAGVTSLIGRRRQPVYEMIERKYDEQVAVVRVDVRAGTIPAELAQALDVAPGMPSLTIIRRYIGRNGRAFQVSLSHHPADRYNFRLELKRGWESDGAWSIT